MPSPPDPTGVDFERPPLTEVGFSIQYDKDVIDEVAALSEFWPRIKSDYPAIEKHPPLPPAAEDFGPPSESSPGIELLSTPPSHRYWFLSPDGTRLVQVQPDRLMFNWRRIVGDEPYPRYETLSAEFSRLLALFAASLTKPAGEQLNPALCELTYINAVVVGVPGGTHGQLARILSFLQRDPVRAALPEVEDTQIQQRFRIQGPGGDPIGRLYLAAVPGFRRLDSAPVYMINLVGRGRPVGSDGAEAVFGFLNKAHRLIVEGFKEVTTPEMHQEWGLVEGSNS